MLVTRKPDLDLIDARRARSTLGRKQRLPGAPAALGPTFDPVRVATCSVIDAEGVAEVVDALARDHCSAQLLGLGWRVSAELVGVDAQRGELLWHCPLHPPQGPITAEVLGYNSLFEFQSPTVRTRDGLLATPVPTRILQFRRRWLRRMEAPKGARIAFADPGAPEVRLERPLRDLSGEGLAFYVEPGDALSPGLSLLNAEVHVPGSPPVRLDCEVRQLATTGRTHFCGVRLSSRDPRQLRRWRELMHTLLHPRIRRGAGLVRETWDLYQRAGYLELSEKEPEQFTRIRQPFERVARLLEASPEVGCHMAWQTESGAVEASMAGLKVYGASWLILQLAKVSGPTSDGVPSRRVLRDINEAVYEHAQHFDPDLRWMTMLLQVKRVWSRLAYFETPKRLELAGMACIVRNRVLEFSTTSEAMAPVPGLDIAPATAEELDTLVDSLARTRPKSYLEAQDLTRQSIGMQNVKRAWGRAGLTRERQVLAAHRDGQLVAAAILESADEGLHLFRLLDSVRLFCLVDGGERAFTPLLEAAREWYRARGRPAFVCYLEEDRPAPVPGELPRHSDLGLADLCILPASHLPEQLEHIRHITAPRSTP